MTRTALFEVEPFNLFAKEPLPEPQWLVEGLFERSSQVVLWGAPGSGKSFVALSWAMHIATGTPWLGKYPVRKCPVFYAVGEGDRGMRRRARAAAKEYGFDDVKDLYFYNTAPRIREPKILEEFLKLIKKLCPGLVVIDTLARSFSGDENSAEAMSDWLNAALIIQQETGACVMNVHHTAKQAKKGQRPTERGSGALRGAMDTSILVTSGECIRLENVKQKEDVAFEDICLHLKTVELRAATVDSKALTSAVIVPYEETIPTSILAPGTSAPEIALMSLTEPMTVEEWRAVTKVDGKEPAVSTFYRWAKKLETEGLAEHDEETGKWRRTV